MYQVSFQYGKVGSYLYNQEIVDEEQQCVEDISDFRCYSWCGFVILGENWQGGEV